VEIDRKDSNQGRELCGFQKWNFVGPFWTADHSERGLVGWMEWKLRFRMKCGQQGREIGQLNWAGEKKNEKTGMVWLLKIFSTVLTPGLISRGRRSTRDEGRKESK
jgi:hypothetical protein